MPTAPRPKRPAKSPPARTNPLLSKTLGNGDKGSRSKADDAVKRAEELVDMPVVIGANGKPLVRIEMAAAELIPTGQFANVSIGPAKVTWYVDPQDTDPISKDELSNVVKALNLIAEVVEVDCIAVQRNLVLESIQTSSND